MPEIEFEDAGHPALKLETGTPLSEALNVTNSPVLFGCRTGICGTCLIEVVDVKDGMLPPAGEFEAESLDLYAPENRKARLACQLEACASMKIKKIESI